MSGSALSVRCRAIREEDLDAVTLLLARGFPGRSQQYWRQGIERHLSSPIPDGVPRLGFVIEAEGRLVGIVLTLYSSVERDGRTFVRCNMSSWYVDPAFRTYAAMLDNVAMRRKDVTYVNISAAPRTWPMHEARGFQRYCRGAFVALPLLGPRRSGARVRTFTDKVAFSGLAEAEQRLLADHTRYGCVCLVGADDRGSEPFVFIRRPVASIRRRLGWSPLSYFHLVYCRSTAALPRFAQAIGKHLLLRRAMPWIVVDAVEPIPGLTGRYIEGCGIKLVRGPESMSLGDLAYTELVLFGP